MLKEEKQKITAMKQLGLNNCLLPAGLCTKHIIKLLEMNPPIPVSLYK